MSFPCRELAAGGSQREDRLNPPRNRLRKPGEPGKGAQEVLLQTT